LLEGYVSKGSIAVKFKTISTVLAALSLGVAPTLAAAQPISTPLTQTASEQVSGDSALRGRGGSGGFLIAGIAIILIGIAIYIAVDKDDSPNSP
jgi:hypothetical protein